MNGGRAANPNEAKCASILILVTIHWFYLVPWNKGSQNFTVRIPLKKSQNQIYFTNNWVFFLKYLNIPPTEPIFI